MRFAEREVGIILLRVPNFYQICTKNPLTQKPFYFGAVFCLASVVQTLMRATGKLLLAQCTHNFVTLRKICPKSII